MPKGCGFRLRPIPQPSVTTPQASAISASGLLSWHARRSAPPGPSYYPEAVMGKSPSICSCLAQGDAFSSRFETHLCWTRGSHRPPGPRRPFGDAQRQSVRAAAISFVPSAQKQLQGAALPLSALPDRLNPVIAGDTADEPLAVLSRPLQSGQMSSASSQGQGARAGVDRRNEVSGPATWRGSNLQYEIRSPSLGHR